MRSLNLLVLALALGATVASAQLETPVGADLVTGGVPEQKPAPEWADVIDLIDSKNGTRLIFDLIEQTGLIDAIESLTNTTCTVFIPLDENVTAAAASLDLTDTNAVANILKYHVVPGQAITLEQFVDGQLLQTALEGKEGRLRVSLVPGSKKPKLVTTSGQRVGIYQYNLQAGEAIVHTIRGVLIPGNRTLYGKPDAAGPAPAA